jgi:SAM-dependent methyltransferase
MGKMSYRDQFTETERALAYEDLEYARGSYNDMLWRLEREQLRRVIQECQEPTQDLKLLDFATGSGRVLEYVEQFIGNCTGIEVSEAMANLARRKVRKSAVLCRDITLPGAEVEDQYDVITAFRFFLNAEPTLRDSALQALRQRLRTKSSVIIFNNHGNLWSHKVLLYPLHRFRGRAVPGVSGNYLSHRQIQQFADKAGLLVERVAGCGVMGGRALQLSKEARRFQIESQLANCSLQRIGVNQLYVARSR